MSRPTKLTNEVQEKIVKDISLGVSYVDAAGAVGIDYDTFNNWMKRGQEASKLEKVPKKEKIFLVFFGAVSQAKSTAFANFTKVITKASMDGEWRAALEYLKRHDPDNWGDSNKLDVTSGGEKLKIEVCYTDGKTGASEIPPEPKTDT